MSLGRPGSTPMDTALPNAPALMSALGWAYDKVIGLPDGGAGRCSEAEIDRKIRFYCAGAGTAGFVTNLGGVFALPVALPANLLSVAALQLRLITEVAVCRGYDVHSEQVRAAAMACLAGNAAVEALKEAGVQLGVRVGQRVAGAALAQVNRAVGARLAGTLGARGAARLTRLVPVMGGVIGGGIDALSTRAVGEIAKRVFTRIEPAPEPGPAPAPAEALRIAGA